MWLKKTQGVMKTSGRGRSRQRLALRDLREPKDEHTASMRWVGNEHRIREAEGPGEGNQHHSCVRRARAMNSLCSKMARRGREWLHLNCSC